MALIGMAYHERGSQYVGFKGSDSLLVAKWHGPAGVLSAMWVLAYP